MFTVTNVMNLKLITLIVIIALSIVLFFFISYSEFTEGMQSLVTGTSSATSTSLTEAMNVIDQIVK